MFQCIFGRIKNLLVLGIHIIRKRIKINAVKIHGTLCKVLIFFTIYAMRKVRFILKFLLFTSFFWITIMWRDGFVHRHLQDCGVVVLDWICATCSSFVSIITLLWDIIKQGSIDIFNALYYLSPLGRSIATDDNFRYCLYWALGACGLASIPTIEISAGTLKLKIEDTKILHTCTIILTILIFWIVWYICFACCHLLVLIPVWFKVLAAIGIIIVVIIVYAIVINAIDEIKRVLR